MTRHKTINDIINEQERDIEIEKETGEIFLISDKGSLWRMTK